MNFKQVTYVYVDDCINLILEEIEETVTGTPECIEELTGLKIYEVNLLNNIRIAFEYYNDHETIKNTSLYFHTLKSSKAIKRIITEYPLPYEKLGKRSPELFAPFKKILRVESFVEKNKERVFINTNVDTFIMPTWQLEKSSGIVKKNFHDLDGRFIQIEWYKKGEIFNEKKIHTSNNIIKNCLIKTPYQANDSYIESKYFYYRNKIIQYNLDVSSSLDEDFFGKVVYNFLDFEVPFNTLESVSQFKIVCDHIFFVEKNKKKIFKFIECLILRRMDKIIYSNWLSVENYREYVFDLLDYMHTTSSYQDLYEILNALKERINEKTDIRGFRPRYYYLSYIHLNKKIFWNLANFSTIGHFDKEEVLKNYFTKKNICPNKINNFDFRTIKCNDQIQYGRYAGKSLQNHILQDSQYFIWLLLNSFDFTIDYVCLHRILQNNLSSNPMLLLLICFCKNEIGKNNYDAHLDPFRNPNEVLYNDIIYPDRYDELYFDIYDENEDFSLTGYSNDNYDGNFEPHYVNFLKSFGST